MTTDCDIRPGDDLYGWCRTCDHVVSAHRWPGVCSVCELVEHLKTLEGDEVACVSTGSGIASADMEPTPTADTARPLILEQYDALEFVTASAGDPEVRRELAGFSDLDALERRYRWRVRHASNGEVLCSGEGYVRADDRDHVCAVLFPDIEAIEVDE